MARAYCLALLAVAAGGLACSTSDGAVGDGGADAPRDVAVRDRVQDEAVDSRVPEAGIPYLEALAVTRAAAADASSALALVPDFSPSVFDYYVRCNAGINVLRVSMKASPGAESLVVLPVASGAAPEQTLTLGVAEDQAIVAVATDGRTSREYWVRCLPHDFPHMHMSPHPEAGAPTPGYYLVGNFIPPPGASAYAMILDGRGVPVWYTRQTAGETVCDVDSIEPGTVSYSSEAPWGGGSILPIEIRHLSPASTTYVTTYGLPTDGHELRRLENGHYLVFWAGIQDGVDLTGLVLPLADGGAESFGPNASISACDVLEVDPLGNVLWTWIGTDHFDPVKDMTFREAPRPGPDGGPVVDAFHCNSIDVDEKGNLLISSRQMDSIFYVDKATGAVVWKMGGAVASKDSATYVPVKKPFYRQHDARFVSWKPSCSGGSGQISLFDDQTGNTAAARAVVYDVNVAPGDAGVSGDCGVFGDGGVTSASVAWEYGSGPSAPGMGSFRILPDGSRVIGWGFNTKVAFTEVDVAGHDLLDFSFTDGSSTYRAVKVPLAAFDVRVLRSAAGL